MAQTIQETVSARRASMTQQEKKNALHLQATAAIAQLRSAPQTKSTAQAVTEESRLQQTATQALTRIAQKQKEQARPAATQLIPTLPVNTVIGSEADIKRRALSALESKKAASTIEDSEIERLAAEDPAQLAERLRGNYETNTKYNELFKEIYPRSGVIDTAKGMGEGIRIGAAEQFPAGVAGAATGIQEALGNFWRMVNTPAQNGEISYEEYVSPLRDDAQRMAQKAAESTAANLEGRGPAAERLIGVSQAAGNMAPAAIIGGAGALAGLGNLTTALVGMGAGGSSYIDAVTQGAGVNEAAAYGLLTGATEAFTERLFGGNPLVDTKPGLVNQLIKKIGGNQKLLSYLASRPVETLNEGMEEAISTIMQPVFQRLTYDPNADFATLEQIADSAIDGVLLAGLMQGGSAAIRSIGNTGSKPTLGSTADAQERATTDAAERVNNFAETTEGESTSVDTNPANHTAAEMNIINDYQDAVDNGVVAFIKKVKGLTNRDYRNRVKITITNVSDRLADEVKNLTGLDTRGFDHVLTGRAIDHIDKRHGANGEADHSMSDINDIARVSYVIDNYEGIELLKNEDGTVRTHSGASTADNKPAPMFRIWKRVNGTYYVVEAATDAKAQEIPIVSAYMAKANGSTDQVLNLPQDGQQLTPEALHGANTSINTNISGDGENVNTNPEGMGAASLGFDPFSNLANRYGTIPEGENPSRIVDVPSQTSDTENVSRTARTAMEAEATPDELLDNIADATVRGDFSDVPITNDETTARARAALEHDGWDATLDAWRQRTRNGRTTADDIALGWILYNNAANRAREDIRAGAENSEAARQAVSILTDMVNEQRNNARKLQAQRILKRLSPEYQLYAVQRSIDSINEGLRARDGRQISVAEELYADYLAAEDDAARDAVLDEIYRDIARQLPPTIGERLRAWRYTAMLGNLKTQSKNIVGNLSMRGVRGVKNVIAGGAESIAAKANPDMARQRTILNPLSERDRALVNIASDIYADAQEAILGEGRNADFLQRGANRADINGRIERYRQDNVFTSENAAVNALLTVPRAYRNLTNWAMESGDSLFARPAFSNALAGWLKANRYTAEDITENRIEQSRLDEGIAFAVEEARQAVFRDHNAFSDLVSGLRSHRDNNVARAVNAAMDIIVPFRRTPANVAVRMYEYSPLSIASVATDLNRMRSGEISASDFIDTVSKTATGTALTALGFLLAKQGILHASGEDDEKLADFEAMQGRQDYSIDYGGRNYTIDSLAPASVPLFIGAELWQQFAADDGYKGMDAWDFMSAAAKSFNPMEQMSMISGITEALSGLDEEQGFIPSIITTAAQNYVSQFIPTLFGQIERTAEGGERRQTYVDRESDTPSGAQYFAGTIGNKLPGEFNQIPYIDAWGRREDTGSQARTAAENFALPFYSKEAAETPIDDELRSLYEEGYDVLPKEAPKDTKVEGKPLTAEQYVEYAEKRGQTSYTLAEILLQEYEALSKDERAKAIETAYDYAAQYGKAEAADYEADKWMQPYFGKDEEKAADRIVYKTLEANYDGEELLQKLKAAKVGEDTIMSAQTEKRQDAWNGGLKQSGISAYDVLDVQYKYNATTGDGKKAQMETYIDRKNLTAAQKTKLYLYLGYSEKTMPKWNN